MPVILSEKVKRTLGGSKNPDQDGEPIAQDAAVVVDGPPGYESCPVGNNLDTFKPIQKCLGIRCPHAGYMAEPDNLVALWCRHLEKAVYEIPSCPNGHWQKDEKGFPIPDPRLWAESWNPESDDNIIL